MKISLQKETITLSGNLGLASAPAIFSAGAAAAILTQPIIAIYMHLHKANRGKCDLALVAAATALVPNYIVVSVAHIRRKKTAVGSRG